MAPGAEVIKVTTAGEPRVVKRQLVTVVNLVATPWNIDGRGRVAFRAEAITPVPIAPPPAATAGSARAGAGAGEQLVWDVSGPPPQLLSDGSTIFIYGPNGHAIEQIDGAGSVPRLATGA